HLSLRDLRRRVGLRRAAQPPRATAVLPGCLIRPVATQLGREVLLELPGSNAQPLDPRPRDQTGGPPPLLLQLAMRFSQPHRPAVSGCCASSNNARAFRRPRRRPSTPPMARDQAHPLISGRATRLRPRSERESAGILPPPSPVISTAVASSASSPARSPCSAA